MKAPRAEAGRAKGFGSVVARLTGGNFLLLGLSFITSPILARTLGPSGRGEVAAIFSIVSLAPWISELGITTYLTRAHARKSHPLGVLLGSTMPIALASAALIALAGVPLAHLLGRGRPVVVHFIEIGLFVLPVAVFAQTLYGITVADQRWNVVLTSRIVSSVGTTAIIVCLAVTGQLTVEAVAIAYVAMGVVANFPFLVSLRGSLPWRFEPAVCLHGVRFGLNSWISSLANVGNVQLDQILMAALVSSRQLGFYSLAVTLSAATSSLVGAAATAVLPRAAVGDSHLAARACRVTVFVVLAFDIVVASCSPIMVPIVFGRAFAPMIPMLLILLASNLFSAPGQILGLALTAGGHPQANARAQLAGLAITVPALLLFVASTGGLGAAWITFAAYGAVFAVVMVAMVRTTDLTSRMLLVVTWSDIRWLRSQFSRRAAHTV